MIRFHHPHIYEWPGEPPIFKHPDAMTVIFMVAECILLAVGLYCLAQGIFQ
jgi:hypothetical protein